MTTNEKTRLEALLNSILVDVQNLQNEVASFYNDVRAEDADDDEELNDVDEVADALNDCEITIADAMQSLKDAKVSFEAPLSDDDDEDEDENEEDRD